MKKRFTILFTLSILSMLLLTSACSRNKQGYTTNPERTVNVAQVDPGWPPKIKKMSLAHQEVLRMKNRPTLVHLRWFPDGHIVDKMTVSRLKLSNKNANPTVSWIYPPEEGSTNTKGEEVIFLDEVKYRILPLSDELYTVCLYGDPQERKPLPTKQAGKFIEQWCYYNEGRIFVFVDGVKVSEERIPSLPHYYAP
jgi:hypothetical protein